MEKQINRCPVCNTTPRVGYACGEYFIIGHKDCRCCGNFFEMHSSEDAEIDSWNSAVKKTLCS